MNLAEKNEPFFGVFLRIEDISSIDKTKSIIPVEKTIKDLFYSFVFCNKDKKWMDKYVILPCDENGKLKTNNLEILTQEAKDLAKQLKDIVLEQLEKIKEDAKYFDIKI